ncbi:MAG TPA: tetratricopeptide repeat protein [Streptosporangiaceae bacterium]|nr:tetratricopeptide repeat protein [Streptosporangiaceae bacterium]
MVTDGQAAELFGSLVRRYRTVATLTQEELASRAGLSVRAVSDMERGRTRRPFLRSVRQLADALELAPPERAQLIAAAEPTAVAGRPDAWDPGFVPPVPRQLPCGPARFTGRTEELGVLAGLAVRAGQEAGTSVVISGTAGVGKTALAVRFAHEVAARFPDGQLYVNLRGAGPTGGPVRPEDVLHAFLGAFGLRDDRLPPDVPAQAALFRSILADRRVLLILDNAHDEQQVRPLLPGSAGCLTLVTSRRTLAGLAAADGARLLSLPVLSLAESLQLLAGRLGDRVEREPEAAARVSALCAGLPLALSVAAARAVAHEGMPLATLADELRQENRLDALDIGDPDTSIRVVMSWSYCNLSAPAAAVFRLFGLQSGPGISAPAAASLAGLSEAQARTALAELTQASLLSEHSSGQYSCHDLLRAYAAELARAVDSEPARQAAIRRITDHYLHTAWSASQHLYPGRWPIELTAAERGVRPEAPASHEQALDWFEAGRATLLAAVTQAAANGLNRHAWQLAWSLIPYFDWLGDLYNWIATQRVAVTAARRAGDTVGLAHAHRLLGRAYTLLGRQDVGRVHLAEALQLSAADHDLVGQALAHHSLGHVCSLQGQHAEDLAHDRQALRLYEAAQHDSGRGWAFNAQAWALINLGSYDEALVSAQQAADVHAQIGDRFHQAQAQDTVGHVQQQLGDYAGAIASYQEALSLCRELGPPYYQSVTLSHLGESYAAAGDAGAAARAWREALDILVDLGHPDADELRTRLSAVSRTEVRLSAIPGGRR